MSVLGKILVKLGLDNSEYKKGLNDSKQSTDKFSSTMSKVGLAIAGAFTIDAIKNFATNAVKAYNESAAAAAKFNAVVKATGGAAGITTEEMQRFASQLQSVTTFEDDATVSAASLLATFKSVNGDVFKQAIVSAQDLATIMGSDLQGAIMQIGKALESPEIGLVALRRSGISFTEMQIEQIKKLVEEGKKHEAQLIILKEIQSQVGGAAKAAAETVGGAWTQAFNAIGDVMEQIGSGIENTMGIAKFLKEGAEGMNLILGSEDLSGWEKLGVLFGFNDKAARKLSASISFLNQKSKENRAIVDGIMEEHVKSVADAQYQLQFLTNVQKGSYQELLKQELEAYIKRANAAKVEQEEKSKLLAIEKQKVKLSESVKYAADTASTAVSKTNELFNKLAVTPDVVLNVKIDREIATTNAMVDEIEFPTFTMDDEIQLEFLNEANDAIQSEIDDSISKMQEKMSKVNMMAKAFEGAVVSSITGGLQELANGIIGVGDVDLSTVVAALLNPFGDLLIQLGVIALTTGLGIEAILTSLTTLNPVAAVAAGIALIALGSVVKAGVSALGKNKGKAGDTAGVTSYSGGGAVAGYSGAMATTSAMSINVTGRISGSDIVLSYDKTKDNKSR